MMFIRLLEKLIDEDDFRDTFQPADEEEIDRRLDDLDPRDVEQVLRDHLGSLDPGPLLGVFDEKSQSGSVEEVLINRIIETLESGSLIVDELVEVYEKVEGTSPDDLLIDSLLSNLGGVEKKDWLRELIENEELG
jgi:hypothetical protein